MQSTFSPLQKSNIFAMNSRWCEGCSSCPDIRTSSPSSGWTVMAKKKIDVKKRLERFSKKRKASPGCAVGKSESIEPKRKRRNQRQRKNICFPFFSADAPRTEGTQRACAKPPPYSIPNGQTFSHAHLTVQEMGGGKHCILSGVTKRLWMPSEPRI